MQQGPRININANDLDGLICTECECPLAIEIFQLKVLPGLYTKSGKNEVIKLPAGYCCKNCGAPMKLDDREKVEKEPKSVIEVVK